MGLKKFIVFKIASVVALLIASGVFMFLVYFIFAERTITINKADLIYLSILLFLLLAGIAFQVQNIWLTNYAEQKNFTWPGFIAYHTVFLMCNAFITIGLGIILYSMMLDLYRRESTQQPISLVIMWFCTTWFVANLVSLIGSLHIRTYLRIRQIRNDRASIEDFGSDVR